MTAESFRALHRAGQPLLLPNAWDYASAAALVDAGFAAVGTTSLGVAAAHGLPDGHGVTRAETLALARRLARLPCHLTVDIEAGFSDDPTDVVRLARDLAAAGAVGVNIEDGRADGTLAPAGAQCELIGEVKAQVPDLFLNARTDTHWLTGAHPSPLDEAVARARAYRSAGADGIFVPGLADDAGIRTVVSAVDAPVNVLYLPGRHTVRQLADLGVCRISCGSLLFRAAIHAAVAAARTIERGESLQGNPPGYAEIVDLIDRWA
jgi:2-methylisocitrate lyase-like PEP mutase family enzyme